jgi:hypothetical protein
MGRVPVLERLSFAEKGITFICRDLRHFPTLGREFCFGVRRSGLGLSSYNGQE